MEPSIYRYPAIFRRVHMEKPGEIEEETEFLKRVWRRHLKRPVRRALDIASGNSPHGQLLAREGIAVAGIDRSPTMIAAGKKEQARQFAGVRFYRRKIEKFRIPEPPFDVAFFMSETFPVLTSNQSLLSHLDSVGRLLKSGGLYCVDIDKMDRLRNLPARRQWQRRRVRTAEAEVTVRTYNRPFPWYSGLHSVFELECEIGFSDRTVVTRDVIPIRFTIPPLLELAAKASRMFEMVAVYTDLSFVTPLAQCDRRWMGVLRRGLERRQVRGEVDGLCTPSARTREHLDRAQLDHRLGAGQRADDRANHPAMGHHKRALRIRAVGRFDRLEHALKSALHAPGECGAAFASGVCVGRREPIGVPGLELEGITLADFLGGQTFEQPEMNLAEFLDRDRPERDRR